MVSKGVGPNNFNYIVYLIDPETNQNLISFYVSINNKITYNDMSGIPLNYIGKQFKSRYLISNMGYNDSGGWVYLNTSVPPTSLLPLSETFTIPYSSIVPTDIQSLETYGLWWYITTDPDCFLRLFKVTWTVLPDAINQNKSYYTSFVRIRIWQVNNFDVINMWINKIEFTFELPI